MRTQTGIIIFNEQGNSKDNDCEINKLFKAMLCQVL